MPCWSFQRCVCCRGVRRSKPLIHLPPSTARGGQGRMREGGPSSIILPLLLRVVAVCCWVVAKSGVAWLSPRDSEAAKCGVAPGVALCVAQPGRAIVADEIVTGIIMGAAADQTLVVTGESGTAVPDRGSEGGLLLMRL